MRKIGFITDEVSQDFEVAAKLADKYGLTGLEIRSVNNKAPQELSDEDIRGIVDVLDSYGLVVPAISAPFFKCELNDEEIAAQLVVLERCIHLAQAVGAKLIRGFTFWDRGGFDEKLPQIVRAFDKPIAMLKAAGMTMVLEHEPSVYAANATKLKIILDAIDSPCIQALWDPGNLMFCNPIERPEDGFRILSPYIRHVHLKDARLVNGKMEAVRLGDGDVGYEEHQYSIKNSGYDGYYMLETHYRLQTKISHDLLALPKGDAFSYMGYEATEESLQAWEEWRI